MLGTRGIGSLDEPELDGGKTGEVPGTVPPEGGTPGIVGSEFCARIEGVQKASSPISDAIRIEVCLGFRMRKLRIGTRGSSLANQRTALADTKNGSLGAIEKTRVCWMQID